MYHATMLIPFVGKKGEHAEVDHRPNKRRRRKKRKYSSLNEMNEPDRQKERKN